uniref:Astacin domain-containing protein n=1 Tax=Parastrongyloides trichosuri TaxID=131310 RepID=A0A0N5A5S7_PARTI
MLFLTALFLSLVGQIYGAIRTDHKWENVKNGIKIYNYTNDKQFGYVMKNLEEETCLNWNKSETQIERGQGINVLWHEKECYSVEIGPNPTKVPNTIFATKDCMGNYYKMLGLMFNALGLSYEHNRNDRDTFIKVDNSSVEDKYKKYLQKDKDLGYETETYGTTYDYGSITHGDPTFYSSNKQETIKAIGKYDGWHEKMIGQKSIESFNEYKLFNYLHCNHTCPTNITCYRGGYQHPKNCDYCKCPYPFVKPFCLNLKPDEGYCAGIQNLNATDKEQKRGFATRYSSCYVYISAPEDKKIRINITSLNFQISENERCSSGYSNVVEIIYEKDESVMGLCLCATIGGIYQNVSVTSYNNEAVFVFKASKFGPSVEFYYMAVH